MRVAVSTDWHRGPSLTAHPWRAWGDRPFLSLSCGSCPTESASRAALRCPTQPPVVHWCTHTNSLVCAGWAAIVSLLRSWRHHWCSLPLPVPPPPCCAAASHAQPVLAPHHPMLLLVPDSVSATCRLEKRADAATVGRRGCGEKGGGHSCILHI